MSDEASQDREPGWYADNAGSQRWWSGRDWTEHVQPVRSQAPKARRGQSFTAAAIRWLKADPPLESAQATAAIAAVSPTAAGRPAGYYDNGQGMRQWWDGTRWGRHFDPEHDAGPEIRTRNLNRATGNYVAAGWTIEFKDDYRVVLSRRIPMSFFLNLIGVLITAGVWFIYILVRLGSPRFERKILVVKLNGVVD